MDIIGNFNSSSQTNLPAVTGTSTASNGVHGVTSSNKDSTVFAEHTGQGIGVFGTSAQGLAGFFEGSVRATRMLFVDQGAVINGKLTLNGQDVGALLQMITSLQTTVGTLQQEFNTFAQQTRSDFQTVGDEIAQLQTDVAQLGGA